MLKPVKWFMQQMAHRLVATVASWMTSTVETMQALDEAEQQAHLEAAARTHETEGNHAAAELLRQRAARIGTDDPGARAVCVMRNVGIEQAGSPADGTSGALHGPATNVTSLDRPVRQSRRRSSAKSNANSQES